MERREYYMTIVSIVSRNKYSSGRKEMNPILRYHTIFLIFIHISGRDSISTSKPECPGSSDHRQFAFFVSDHVPSHDSDRAPVVLLRREVKIRDMRDCQNPHVGVGRDPLQIANLSRVDLGSCSHLFVEDVESGEVGRRMRCDGGGGDGVGGGVRTGFYVLDVEMERGHFLFLSMYVGENHEHGGNCDDCC